MARRRLAPAQPGDRPAPDLPPRPAPPPIAQVAGEAAAEAALRTVSAALEAARSEGRLVLPVPLGDIDPGHLARDRLDPEDAELAALRESLRAHGQRVPIEVTPLAGRPPYGLISGWRRLAALKALHAETGEARFATVAALVRRPDTAAAAYVAMVEENEVRSGLSYYERARITAVTAALGVFPSEQEALRRLFSGASRARRSKIGSFLLVHHALGPRLRWPQRIPERLGLRLAGQIQAGGTPALQAALDRAGATGPEAELAALEAALRPSARPEPAWEEIRPGLRLRLAQTRGGPVLTLAGPELDPGLVARLRAVLAGPDRGR